MGHFFLVALGGAIGAGARHLAGGAALRLVGSGFPAGTLFVNVAGSLAMGLLVGYFAFRGEGGQAMRLFLATGVLGGFTTFSAFSLDTVLMLERGEAGPALIYVAASLAGSIAGLMLGMAVVRALQ